MLIALPLLAVVAFASLSLAAAVSLARSADHTRALVGLAGRASTLAYNLQAERADAVMVLLGHGSRSRAAAAYRAQIAASEAAFSRYQQRRRVTTATTPATRAVLGRLDGELRGLVALRSQITNRDAVAITAVTFQYRIAIADLLAYDAVVAQAGAPADIANQIRTNSALAQAREYASQEQVDVLVAASTHVLTPSAREQITGAHAGYADAMEAFGGLAPSAWLDWLSKAMVGPGKIVAQRLEGQATGALVQGRVDVDPTIWSAAMAERVAALASVGTRIDAAVLAQVKALHDEQVRTAAQVGLAVTLVVVVVSLLGYRSVRDLTGRLTRLSTRARTVAFTGLPRLVENLRRPDGLAGQSPSQVAIEQSLRPTMAGLGRDEIGDVADAFGEVLDSAVRLAAEQARDRAEQNTMFVSVARRGDRIVGRLQRLLDEAERDEVDEDRLAMLFRFDHLTTRLGRSNRTLLVLGGETTARRRSEPVPLTEVLRGALAQIEHLEHVEIRGYHLAIAIRPEVVDDLVHLCAELLDNATTFASPELETMVDCHLLGDRVIVQISDLGVGIAPQQRAELNERLKAPEIARLRMNDSMGLTAVSTIAAAHGIRVELKPQPMSGSGTLTEITIPRSAFVELPPPPPITVRAPRPRQPSLAAAPGRPAPWPDDTTRELPSVGAASIDWNDWFTPSGPDSDPLIADDGLPKRVAMTSLAPGLAVPPPASRPDPRADQRNSRQIQAAIAAFERGVARSRDKAAAPPTQDQSRRTR